MSQKKRIIVFGSFAVLLVLNMLIMGIFGGNAVNPATNFWIGTSFLLFAMLAYVFTLLTIADSTTLPDSPLMPFITRVSGLYTAFVLLVNAVFGSMHLGSSFVPFLVIQIVCLVVFAIIMFLIVLCVFRMKNYTEKILTDAKNSARIDERQILRYDLLSIKGLTEELASAPSHKASMFIDTVLSELDDASDEALLSSYHGIREKAYALNCEVKGMIESGSEDLSEFLVLLNEIKHILRTKAA